MVVVNCAFERKSARDGALMPWLIVRLTETIAGLELPVVAETTEKLQAEISTPVIGFPLLVKDL